METHENLSAMEESCPILLQSAGLILKAAWINTSHWEELQNDSSTTRAQSTDASRENINASQFTGPAASEGPVIT
jgi:hypothetical protein